MVGENLREEVTKLSLEKGEGAKNGKSGRRRIQPEKQYVQGPRWERKQFVRGTDTSYPHDLEQIIS